MKIVEFEYEKKDGTKSNKEVLILNKSEKYTDGIDMTYLNEDEKSNLIKLQENYETEIKKFNKAYRKYFNEKMKISKKFL